MSLWPRATVAAVVCLCASAVWAASHTFKENDRVTLYANKVGPFNNPRHVMVLPAAAQDARHTGSRRALLLSRVKRLTEAVPQ